MSVLISSKVFLFFKSSLQRLQNLKIALFDNPFPLQALAFPHLDHLLQPHQDNPKEFGFLWAVPKKRVSLERRLSRRVAHTQKWNPKNNFLVCNVCGHYHLSHTICGNCYERVKQVTNEMKEAIQEKLKLDPVDKEVIVLYADEPKPKTSKNELLIEIPKEKPAWFSKNLLSKANEVPVRTKPTKSDTSDD